MEHTWRCFTCGINHDTRHPVYYRKGVFIEKLDNVLISVCSLCGDAQLHKEKPVSASKAQKKLFELN